MSNKLNFEFFIDANNSYSDIFFDKKIVGFEVIYKFATINRSNS